MTVPTWGCHKYGNRHTSCVRTRLSWGHEQKEGALRRDLRALMKRPCKFFKKGCRFGDKCRLVRSTYCLASNGPTAADGWACLRKNLKHEPSQRLLRSNQRMVQKEASGGRSLRNERYVYIYIYIYKGYVLFWGEPLFGGSLEGWISYPSEKRAMQAVCWRLFFWVIVRQFLGVKVRNWLVVSLPTTWGLTFITVKYCWRCGSGVDHITL